jgi:8-oxo-dGTP diphosphatase
MKMHKTPDQWPPKMAVCVGAVVQNHNKILFIRQAKGHSLAGQWSMPWGLVDDLETPEDAALRETYEESGISAEIEGLLGIQNLPTPGWLGIIFACHHAGGEPHPDGVETDRAAYLSLEEIVAFEEPFEPWCRWLAGRILSGRYKATPCLPNNPYAPRKAFL